MRIRTWLAPVSIAVIASLTACSSGSKPDAPGPASSATVITLSPPAGSGSAAPPSTTPASASGQGGSPEIDACTLLTTAQAAAQVGKTYTSAVSSTIASGQDQCTYHASDDSADLVIIVYQPSSGVSWPMMQSVQSGVGTVKAVSGVGDKAMIGQIELDVQAGQRLVAVQGAGGLLTGSYSSAVSVAKIVVGGLH
jgi:hypothetical protein